MSRKSKIILLTVSLVYILDRLTKLYIVGNVGLLDSIPVVGGWFDIVYVRNTGAAFGFMALVRDSLRIPFFLATTLAALAMLFYFVRKTGPGDTLMLVALALIIGGALGNLTDRLIFGYVIDFIDWHVGGHHWPAFNIADSGITVGVALLGVEVLLTGGPAGDALRP